MLILYGIISYVVCLNPKLHKRFCLSLLVSHSGICPDLCCPVAFPLLSPPWKAWAPFSPPPTSTVAWLRSALAQTLLLSLPSQTHLLWSEDSVFQMRSSPMLLTCHKTSFMLWLVSSTVFQLHAIPWLSLFHFSALPILYKDLRC